MATSNTGALARSQDGANWTDISGNIGADISQKCCLGKCSKQHWVVVRETGVVYINVQMKETHGSGNKLNRMMDQHVFTKSGGR